MVLRVRIVKGEEARFVSHLGFMRAFERAMRRAEIPVAYSEGYHPLPKFSFATALGVGVTSEAEYADIQIDPGGPQISVEEALDALDTKMPPGLAVVEACSYWGKPSLASRVEYASYRTSACPELKDAASVFMGLDTSTGTITTKSGQKEIDIRKLVREISVSDSDALEFVCACGGRAHLRPENLLAHLYSIAGADPNGKRFRIHRTGLFFVENGDLVSPMAYKCKDLVIAKGWKPKELS
ncbi:MAG: TIGR03936 family radical SAM-associated protein [Firmicutes bacterium]|jgi:radical SAM-linked protein|nr:TIGR03936 family radical SAM-associated protein [Bacillota bacterium]MDD4791882.1 TIGR03936 family radical SAM-associated protein [Bacillota bacterium]